MIRAARLSDSPRAVELLRDSRLAAGFDSPGGLTGFCFPFDPLYAARLFMAHLGQPHRLCLVLDVDGMAQGVLMAVASEHPFGPVWLARESVWWIDPAHRGTAALRMLDAYEAWAAQCGCACAGMAGMGDDPQVATLYRRRGYRTAEIHFLKAFA